MRLLCWFLGHDEFEVQMERGPGGEQVHLITGCIRCGRVLWRSEELGDGGH